MRGLWLSLCMLTSFPNFASYLFICQFQGFPLVQFLYMPATVGRPVC